MGRASGERERGAQGKDAVKAAKKQRWQGQPDTWQATKDTWQDAPAKGKWQREPVYYVDDYQQRRAAAAASALASARPASCCC